MEEAQVVAGIPTLSVDPQSLVRNDSLPVTETARTNVLTTPAVMTPTVETQAKEEPPKAKPAGPSIYPRKRSPLPAGGQAVALPHWPFWVADGVLLAAAVFVWLSAPRPMSVGSMVLAALLILVGAGLAVVPWLMKSVPRKAAVQTKNSTGEVSPLQRLPFRLK